MCISEISILEKNYQICDVLSGIVIEDSAVCKKHKIGGGHGERKIYLPGNLEEKNKFFDNFSEKIQGFLLKADLKKYLKQAKKEFLHPTQEYQAKTDLRSEYKELNKKIDKLDDKILIEVEKSDVTHSGMYINHSISKKRDVCWNLIGDIALPRISRLSILKLSDGRQISYYFKMSFGVAECEIEEDDGEYIKKIEESNLKPTEKDTVIKARIGQGKYRTALLEESCVCPFTLVDDEHLLVASHIKPWKKSNNFEKRDSKNGFLFTPTYDKLFDRGYISFNNDKTLIISPWLSEYNRERLNLKEGMLVEHLPEIDSKRQKYLDYHRGKVLKSLEDL